VAGQRPALRQKLRRPLGAPLDELIHGQDSAPLDHGSVMSKEEFRGVPELGMENLEFLAFQIPEVERPHPSRWTARERVGHDGIVQYEMMGHQPPTHDRLLSAAIYIVARERRSRTAQ
jgi:hypothetical protein